MGTGLIESTASRRLARELALMRADLEAIKEGQRSTQLDFSTLLYPLIVRDPASGDVLGTIGQQTDGGLALNRVGGPAPPAPTAPTLSPLMSGVLVEWDGKFTDPNYVVAAHRAAVRGTVPIGRAAQRLAATIDVGAQGDVPPGKLEAAQLILDRLKSTKPIFEDWTWAGCPSVVGTWNDVLLDEAAATGLSGNDWPFSAQARSWLAGWIGAAQDAIEAAKAGGASTSSTGGGSSSGSSSSSADPGDWYIPRSPDNPEKVVAANAILNRIRSGSPIGPDWTWTGCPAVVTTWHGDLQNEWRASGKPAEAWLQAYTAIQDTRPSNFGYVGIHVGDPGFVTDPSNMVGVLSRAGGFPVSPVDHTIEVRLVGYNDSYPPVAGPASDSVQCTPDQVVAQAVLDGIVDTLALKDEAVATGKMKLAAVQSEILAAAAVQQLHLGAAAVTGPAIASSAITSDHISANAVYADAVQSFAIIAGKIAAGAVSADAILANSITAEKFAAGAITAQEVAAGSITTEKLAALAITSDKIAANAILAGHLSVGSVTADKLAALLVMTSRLIAGDPTGTRAEVNAQGFEAWRGATKTFDVDAATGVAFMLGQFATADAGPRVVINPGGSQPDTIRFYPANNDATWSSIDSVSWGGGQVSGIRIVGSGSSSTANRGMVVVRDQYASLVHGRTDLSYWGAEVWVEQAFTRNKAAVVDLIIDERLAPWGGGRRVAMIHYNTSGQPISATQLQYEKTTFNGGEPFLVAVGQSSGWVFAPGKLWAKNNGNTALADIGCNVLTQASGRASKRDIRTLSGSALEQVRGWTPRRYRFAHHGPEGREHVGFLAEDLPHPIRVTTVSPHVDDGEPEVIESVDTYALLTTVAAAVRELAGQVDELRHGRP